MLCIWQQAIRTRRQRRCLGRLWRGLRPWRATHSYTSGTRESLCVPYEVGRDNAGKAKKRTKIHRQSYQLIVPMKRVNKRREGRGWRATNAFHGNMEPTREAEMVTEVKRIRQLKLWKPNGRRGTGCLNWARPGLRGAEIVSNTGDEKLLCLPTGLFTQ